MNATKKGIIAYGRELAGLDPRNKKLQFARQWWAEGCPVKYSNQDFDVLNSLVCEVSAIKNGWR